MFSFAAEGFFCSLGVLYGGLWISKLQFLIKKIKIKSSSCKFRIRIKSMRICNPAQYRGGKNRTDWGKQGGKNRDDVGKHSTEVGKIGRMGVNAVQRWEK